MRLCGIFFTGKASLLPYNCTSITLIPKTTHASLVKWYRLISCFTVIYKIVAKILVANLQKVIPKLVSQAQIGFKFIILIVILATEIIIGYNFSQISQRCLIKVDMMNAYDSID